MTQRRRLSGGDLRVRRTSQGYIAVLRVAGADGQVGATFTEACSFEEAGALLDRMATEGDELAMEIGGFSFAGIARAIGKAASSVAKSKVFKSLVGAAGMLPPPVGTVAKAAANAAKALQGMRQGAPAARAAWEAGRRIARAAPHSPAAVGMRLAMAAVGPPVMGRPAASPSSPPPAPSAVAPSAPSAERAEETLPMPEGSAPSAPGPDTFPFSSAELDGLMGGG